ncbi:MAG: magnesium transporter CorA family protein [Clostridia bacterium]|nr:magnesium transporter CorA family protein [Clostridia bacterium]
MLEIYVTRTETVGTRTVGRLESVDEIERDCWINMTSPTEAEIARVRDTLTIPPEFFGYSLDENERPLIDADEDTGCILIIVDMPTSRTEAGRPKYETSPLGIILADHVIVTLATREFATLNAFRHNQVRDFRADYRTRFTLQLMYAGAKDYLKTLLTIDKTIEDAERKLNRSVSNQDLFALMQLGKTLVYYSTSLQANITVLERLSRSRTVKQYEEDTDLLEDVMIENRQAIEMTQIYTSIINGTMDAYASIISNNLNVVMKFMAAMTIALTVPTLITSFFGQNITFPFDPGFLSNPFPFIITVGIIVLSTGAVIWWLNKRGFF